jgi:uncharacterized protein
MKLYLKIILIATVVACAATTGQAQGKRAKQATYQVVFQLSSSDTLIHKSLTKQLNNLLTAMPGITIEVVTHGPGITFLQKSSTVKNNLDKLQQQGITFLACRNTLLEKKIDPASLLPFVNVIPAGLAHIIRRQSEGWSYIKAGF